MESGLEGRNNCVGARVFIKENDGVSMESGLEGRNNGRALQKELYNV